MAEKRLRFGGPGLPAGQHTYYVVRDDSGDREFRAEVGHEAPLAGVVNAQDYIDRGLASIVTGKAATAEVAASGAAAN